MEERRVSKKAMLKFTIVAIIGLGVFLVPIQYNGSMNIIVGVLSEYISKVLETFIDEIILGLLIVSFIGSCVDYVLTKRNHIQKGRLHKIFETTGVYLITKGFSLFMVCLLCMGKGFAITEEMMGLGKTLVALAVALSYFLPFLTDGGLMEFVGEIAKPIVNPLFKVPSDAALDLLASWMGASNAAVILSADKYEKGYYTKREAANVMCNFSLVSISFCLVIASTAKVEQYFAVMYALLCGLGIILAIIAPRIYPLNRLEDTYFLKKYENHAADDEQNMLKRAFVKGCTTAEQFTAKYVIGSGTGVMLNICLNLVPIVIGWGILGMVVIEYTPVLNWISMPMGWLLDILGVEEAFAVAPATLAGFIDMFIPVMLIAGVKSVETRFIITTLSLIQIIYITEVGTIIIKSGLGIDLKKLIVIFLERTLISLPIIVFVSKLIF